MDIIENEDLKIQGTQPQLSSLLEELETPAYCGSGEPALIGAIIAAVIYFGNRS